MSNDNQELCSTYHKQLCEFFHLSYEKQQLCDVVLIAALNQQTISAHRLVLGALSPYFAAMFTNEMLEKNKKEIVLEEIDGDNLKLLVDYCYTGSIAINEANVYSVLETSSRLEFQSVETKCYRFLDKTLNASNCLTVFTMVDPYLNFQKLVKKSLDCAALNFEEIAAQHEFLLLNKNHLSSLLRMDELNVWSEEEIFHALVKWVTYDADDRKHDVCELLELMRFSQIRSEFLQELVHPFLEEHKVDKNVFTLKFAPGKKQVIEPRKSTVTPRILALNCVPGDDTCEVYCSQLKKWKSYPDLKSKAQNNVCCAVILNDVLYIFENLMEMTVHTFDFTTAKARKIEAPRDARHDFAAIVMHDSIYIAGGHRSSTVERYDTSTGKWIDDVSPMLEQRAKFTLNILKNRLIAIGGWNSTGTLRSVEAYDSFTNKWAPLAPMNLARDSHSVAVYENKIYVVGGNDSGSLEYYDPIIGWTLVEAITVPRFSFGLAISGSTAVVIGGRIKAFGNSERSAIEINLKTLTQKDMKPMKHAKGTCCALYMPTYNPN